MSRKNTKRIKQTTCLQKILKKIILVLIKNLHLRKRSAILDRIRKVRNSKYESDLFKIIRCFIDGSGSVNSERVNFSINF